MWAPGYEGQVEAVVGAMMRHSPSNRSSQDGAGTTRKDRSFGTRDASKAYRMAFATGRRVPERNSLSGAGSTESKVESKETASGRHEAKCMVDKLMFGEGLDELEFVGYTIMRDKKSPGSSSFYTAMGKWTAPKQATGGCVCATKDDQLHVSSVFGRADEPLTSP